MTRIRVPRRRIRGLSMIELMVAIAISTFLILGIVQVFSASKAAYLASEGLARVQEGARFALDFVQRDVRMAGHMGCKSDLAYFHPLLANGRSFFTTLAVGGNTPGPGTNTTPNSPDAFRFDVGIEGHEFTGTARGAGVVTYDLSALGENPPATSAFGSWTPAIPAGGRLRAAMTAGQAIAGSDVIVVRYLSAESVPLSGPFGRSGAPPAPFDQVRVANAAGIGGVDALDLYAVSNCAATSLFQASATLTAGVVPVVVGGLNVAPLGGSIYGVEARLHRAESVAYFVGVGNSGRPVLKRVRFNDLSGGNPPVEELVEGVENLQIEYGYDNTPAGQIPDASTDVFAVASDVNLGGAATAAAQADGWRRVRSVRIAMLVRSDEPAVSPPPAALIANGVTLTPFADQRVRVVYQTTVTLRNRLVGTGA